MTDGCVGRVDGNWGYVSTDVGCSMKGGGREESGGKGKQAGRGSPGGLHAGLADRPRRGTPQARDPGQGGGEAAARSTDIGRPSGGVRSPERFRGER